MYTFTSPKTDTRSEAQCSWGLSSWYRASELTSGCIWPSIDVASRESYGTAKHECSLFSKYGVSIEYCDTSSVRRADLPLRRHRDPYFWAALDQWAGQPKPIPLRRRFTGGARLPGVTAQSVFCAGSDLAPRSIQSPKIHISMLFLQKICDNRSPIHQIFHSNAYRVLRHQLSLGPVPPDPEPGGQR